MALARARRDSGIELLARLRRRAVDAGPRHHLPAHRVRGRAVLPDAGSHRQGHRAGAPQRADRPAHRAAVAGEDRQVEPRGDSSPQLRASLAAAEGERDRFKGLYEGVGSGAADAQGKVSELAGAARRREAAHRRARWRRSSCSTSRSRRCAASSPRSKARSTPPRRRTRKRRRRIADLGQRLNVALAQRVQELSRYRSDFFGRLRAILGNRPDIRIVGDRFVFQSEVFFDTGQAVLEPEGRAELDKLAAALLELEQADSRRDRLGAARRRPHRRAPDRERRSSSPTGSCRPRAPSRWCST